MVLDIPPILKERQTQYNRNNNTIIPDSLQFSVYGSVVPELTVKAVETRFAGSNLFVSSHSRDSYPPVNIKFAVDSQYNNYWVIYQWLNLLHDEKTGVYNQRQTIIDGNFNDYFVNMTIYGLDEYKNKKIKFTYTKAFPTSLDELVYNEQDTGEMELISGFSFVFSQLHTELIDSDIFSIDN
ncbi:MAG: hypothetical protein MIO92_15185 [Methanosarcinaceae archaeon]|nr:hypothetical protein [Methanosarcinaceae archaeon]